MLARDLSLMGSASTVWRAALEDQLLETAGKQGGKDSILGQRDDLRWSEGTEFSSILPGQKKNCFGMLSTVFTELLSFVAILGH